MTTKFAQRVERGITIVDVVGEVDIANVASLEALIEVVADQSPVFIVSLAGATYFDSRTLHLIAQTTERAQVTRRRALFVAPADPGARRLLRISGIDNLMDLHASEADALAEAAAV